MSRVSLDRRSLLALMAGGAATFSSLATVGQVIAGGGIETSVTSSLQLQAIGSLGVGHIQGSLGFIGVIADSVKRDIYSQKQIEDLLIGTINGIELPKKMLRQLQDMNISAEDKEFLDRMIGVFNALQKEANALLVYSKSRKQDDAQRFERDRRQVLKKLSDLTHQDEPPQANGLQPLGQVPLNQRTPRTASSAGLK